jgi:hypothetical protein
MKLTLATNIGAKDAKRLGLTKTLRGDTVDVKDKKAEEILLSNGWAIRTDGKEAAKAAAAEEEATTRDDNPPPAAKDGGGGGNADFNPLTPAEQRARARKDAEAAAEVVRDGAAGATPVRIVEDATRKGAKSK